MGQPYCNVPFSHSMLFITILFMFLKNASFVIICTNKFTLKLKFVISLFYLLAALIDLKG